MALAKAGADVHGKDNTGYGSWAASSGRLVCHSVGGGRSVHSGAALQECRFWLCRMTALHLASQNGKTQTAVALFLADVDALCPSEDGYGFGLHRGTAASPIYVGSAQREGYGSRRVEL